jgi:hypothetical protein
MFLAEIGQRLSGMRQDAGVPLGQALLEHTLYEEEPEPIRPGLAWGLPLPTAPSISTVDRILVRSSDEKEERSFSNCGVASK